MWKMIIGIILWFGVVPSLAGTLVLSFWKRHDDRLAECIITGYLLMFAICQIIAIPMIFLEIHFSTFCRILVAIYMITSILGFLKGGKWFVGMIWELFRNLTHHAWTVYAAVAAVLVQAYYYVQYMVTNLDDAYYVAVATTAIETDTMYRFSPYTGRAVTGFNLRYCLSPFSMLQAFFSQCLGVHPSTLDHTIMAPAMVIVAYFVYISMGRLLFSEKSMAGEKKESREKMIGLFLVFLSMVHVTSYYCMRNQGSVLLVRIWQGKATLAAVLIPFLFYHCYRMAQKPWEKGNTVILVMAAFACCLVSSMGIVLPMVMMGIFALLFGVFQKNGRYVATLAAGCVPGILYGILYVALKALKLW